MNARSLLIAAALLAAAAGCSRSSHAPATQSTTSSTRATSAPGSTAAPATTAPATTMATTSTTAAGTGSCPTSALAASLTSPSAAAGTAYSRLVFRNTSAQSCTLAGYPGVSFVDASGHQIGAPAPREHRFAGTVMLAPGGSAGAVFAYHDVYVSSVVGCNSVMATGLRIYPPNQTAALFVARSWLVCSNPSTAGTASISEVTTLGNLPGPG